MDSCLCTSLSVRSVQTTALVPLELQLFQMLSIPKFFNAYMITYIWAMHLLDKGLDSYPEEGLNNSPAES